MKYLRRFNEAIVWETNEIVEEILEVIENDPFLLSNVVIMKSKYLKSSSNPSEGYFLKFHYKEMVIEVSKLSKDFYLYGKHNNTYRNRHNTYRNRHNTLIDGELHDLLYKSILDASERNSNLIWLLKDRGILKSNNTTNELLERIIEFDVIKGDSVDLISLNSLYDFYDIKFSKIADIDFFNHHNIKYIE